MLFGYVSGVSPDGDQPELCIVANKESGFSVPVRISSLRITECAIHMVSAEEGITVARDTEKQGAIVISPIKPGKLYLTPNLPERPGYTVDRIRVTRVEENKWAVEFDRERGWTPWTPNERIY
jgi:hypothetical protein